MILESGLLDFLVLNVLFTWNILKAKLFERGLKFFLMSAFFDQHSKITGVGFESFC